VLSLHLPKGDGQLLELRRHVADEAGKVSCLLVLSHAQEKFRLTAHFPAECTGILGRDDAGDHQPDTRQQQHAERRTRVRSNEIEDRIPPLRILADG
jgi:hypothetical protein